MAENVAYHQQVSYCGKARCRKCREGIGHGPYWYAYRTENGRTIRTYIGKNPPPEALIQQEAALAPDQSGVRVRTLGQFGLERFTRQGWQNASESAWQQHRVRSLLACLLSSPGRKLAREQVMDLLWPEADFETTASRLDRAVYSLRQALEPALSRPAMSRLLLTEHDSIILADQSQLWVDADHFEQLLAEAHNIDDPGQAEQLLDEAAALYGGDYLPVGADLSRPLADWAAARRELLQRAWMGLMLELADLRINRDAFVTAIDPLDRLLAVDLANEAAVQRLIYALARLNRRGEALRAYHRFADAMQHDYGIAPLPETRLLYEAIQHGDTRLENAPPFRPLLASAATLASQRNGANAPRTPPRAQIGRSHQHPLIGRENELEALHAALQGVTHSGRAGGRDKSAPTQSIVGVSGRDRSSPMQGMAGGREVQCLLLVGEAGIGKTRLAEELSRAAQNAGWAVAWSRVYSQESSVPYRQWTEVLRSAMAHGLWQRQEIAKNRALYQPLCSLLPELQDLFGKNPAPASLSPEQEQLRLWEAALQLLITISERTPLLIVLDDFHWADASSCDLLAYLVRRLRGRPIVMIGTYRDNELPSSHPLRALLTDLHREQVVTTLPIQPLSDEQIAALVAELPGALVQHIQRQAAGNPFFAEELARSLADTPDLPATPASMPLPDTISAVLELRMSRLTQPCQRLLSNASVIGGSFTFAAIAGLEAGGSSTSEDAVLDLIEEAIQSGVVTEEGTGTRITYHFWHPLLVSHLYDQLSAARRTRLHRRAAAILQRAYQGNEAEGAALIANHLVEGGGEPEEVIHYAALAADHAYALSAYPEAERYYRLAVTQLDENGNGGGGSDRGGPIDRGSLLIYRGGGRLIAPNPGVMNAPATAQAVIEQLPTLAYLLERLGECTRNLGNYEEARHLYQRVLSVRGGPIDRASRGSGLSLPASDSQYEAQIDALLWREIALTWYDIGDNASARQCCERGAAVLQASSVTSGPAWASIHFLQSYISWREGNYAAARTSADEALRLYEQTTPASLSDTAHLTGTQRTLAGDPVNVGRTHSLVGAITNSIGHTDEALTYFHHALTIFEQHDRPREIAHVSCNIGDAHLRKADLNPANAAFRRALHLAERVGETSLKAIMYGNFGVLAAQAGDLQEARNWYRQGITLTEQINDQVYFMILYSYLSIAQQYQGQLDDARQSIYRALSVSHLIRHPPLIGFALIVAGMLRIAQAMQVRVSPSTGEQASQKRGDIARRFLKRALASLERALAFDELDAEIRYEGQLARAQALFLLGEREAARQQARAVYEETSRQELTWTATRAAALLGSILAAQGQWEEATRHFEQAMQVFQQREMRLELARTRRRYGLALLRREGADRNERQHGLYELREARQAFQDCGAALDLRLVERDIARREKK
jgi:DNA-binding SARP family transcriptional activator